MENGESATKRVSTAKKDQVAETGTGAESEGPTKDDEESPMKQDNIFDSRTLH